MVSSHPGSKPDAMQPPSLLHLAAQTPGLDWESLPESVSYQLYQHAHNEHRARFASVLADIRLSGLLATVFPLAWEYKYNSLAASST